MTYNQAYYVALGTRYTHVRGIDAAYQQLAIYLGITAAEVKERRAKQNCAGLIVRVSAAKARAAGL